MLDAVYIIGGLVVLLVAGDFLVRGAVALSLRLGISALVVSLTVVSFGTSAPELLISVQSALEGVPGIALGNVVGSNVANVLLVLGVPALLAAIDPKDCDTRRNYWMMIIGTIVFMALAWHGPLMPWHGIILLGFLAIVLFDAIAMAQNDRAAAAAAVSDEGDLDSVNMPYAQVSGYLVAGIVGLPIGAHMLIEGASNVALQMGISEAAIGLTLVAIGTSLPELATTVMASLRRQADVALGNVIGSNMFNLMAIMGVASFFGPLPVPDEFLSLDLWVMLAASLALIPMVYFGMVLTRFWGMVFLAAYCAYIWVILT